MANYANLLATIAANIYTNNNNEVTASMVKAAVDAMVATLGTMREALPSTDLDDVTSTGTWILTSNHTYSNVPGNSTVGFLRVSEIDEGNWALQEYYTYNGGELWKRRSLSGLSGWEAWQKIGDDGMRAYLPSGSLSDVTTPGVWLLIDSNTYTDTPNNDTTGFLRVSVPQSGSFTLQEFFSFSGEDFYARRVGTAWKKINGVKNVTNNYEFNSYSNTSSIVAHPTITTDANNYLATTGDTTDRTADILTMLQTTGVCNLGPGDFYIDGLVMPDDSILTGCGSSTKVYLISGSNKFCVSMGKRNTIRNISFFGNTSAITPSASIGTRHGILWAGNYTQTGDNDQQPQLGIVSGCFFNSFAGGGITCADTGYGTLCHLEVSDCIMENCDAGINVEYWSEYHKFTNVRTNACYFGCVNNGGNNVFANCDFSSCKEAFLMDNSQSQSPNNSHGSCVGCVFNHTDSNTGVGIRILNCGNGFIFSGCQIFFSQIVIEDTYGIVFQGCNFGTSNQDISITNGGAIVFSNNMHGSAPTITIANNSNVHFVNCYNRATGAPISA